MIILTNGDDDNKLRDGNKGEGDGVIGALFPMKKPNVMCAREGISDPTRVAPNKKERGNAPLLKIGVEGRDRKVKGSAKGEIGEGRGLLGEGGGKV